MAKMIKLETGHWIDPDTIEHMYLCEPTRKRGHTYYVVALVRPRLYEENQAVYLGGKYTAKQAEPIFKRIVNGQTVALETK